MSLRGPVVEGFGRGSKDLGVPTANIDPASVGDRIDSLPSGVFYGWARVDLGGPSGVVTSGMGEAPLMKHHGSNKVVTCCEHGMRCPAVDTRPLIMYKSITTAVMNIGRRPTMHDGGGVSVEVHMMGGVLEDFHGANLWCVGVRVPVEDRFCAMGSAGGLSDYATLVFAVSPSLASCVQR